MLVLVVMFVLALVLVLVLDFLCRNLASRRLLGLVGLLRLGLVLRVMLWLRRSSVVGLVCVRLDTRSVSVVV